MAPSRSRSSLVSGSRRSQAVGHGSDGTSVLTQNMQHRAPPYTPPTYPLSDAAIQKLSQLKSKYERKQQDKKAKKAIVTLASCIYDLNRRLQTVEARWEKENDKGDDADEERLARFEQDYTELKEKMGGLTGRIEKNARVCVDVEAKWNAMLRAVELSAMAGAQPAVGRRETQSGLDSSFEPTLPGATAQSVEEQDSGLQEPQGVSVLAYFRDVRRTSKESWAAKSLLDRYGHHPEYKEFKAREYEGYHGDEAECPPPSRWFDAPDAQPGTATQGAGDESDDDVQIARARISTKCPLTLMEFEQPVISRACKHTFEKKAILDMIGRAGQAKQCPVPGCPHLVSRSQLSEDDPLLRKIKRIQEGRTRTQTSHLMYEDVQRHGNDADTSILLSDDVDAEGYAALDSVSKLETTTQTTQDRARAAPVEIHEDEMEGDVLEDEDDFTEDE